MRGHKPRQPKARGSRPGRPFRQNDDGPIHIYGFHPVRAALDNPERVKSRLLATPNALNRLIESGPLPVVEIAEVTPRDLDRLLGPDAVHQGVALLVDPIDRPDLQVLSAARLVLLLDQVTDPHNVGAILRTACAFGADALITTARYAPGETGVLAKSASGALDLIPFVEVKNLGSAIEELQGLGFTCLGLDSEAPSPLTAGSNFDKLALVLGAEGKGLRQKTRDLCDELVRLDMPGPIKSLNVSNAAAIALFAATSGGHT
jgi:23S rRNA (guanosine2251-2'-O)-methyltransferase